ncbi:MAG: hypothetical protein ACXADB_14820, partial [Candidatus Hermodarchaeia archaeon]
MLQKYTMDPIKFIAAQITSDPNIINEDSSKYTAEEVEIPMELLPPELRSQIPQPPKAQVSDLPGDGGYAGLPDEDEFSSGGIFTIEFEFEYDYHPGERRTYDYPGSPAYLEVTHVDPKVIEGPDGPISLTPELIAWAVEWFHDNEDEIMESESESAYDDYDPSD